MNELTLHNFFRDNLDLQKSFLNLIGLPQEASFIHEHSYPNNLFADFSILSRDNKIKAIVELKGSDIGVTEYVRGIGQIFQYQHFADKNISYNNNNYENVRSILCFPSQLLINNSFHPGLFIYPENSLIIEINEHNLNPRILDKEILFNNAFSALTQNLVSISPYYIRDNRLFEIHLCLKYLHYLVTIGTNILSRNDIEANFLQRLGTPNNRNWRNAFISLSSLGLIDGSNKPTLKGNYYAQMDFRSFAYEIYKSYIYPYIDTIINSLFPNPLLTEVDVTYDDLKKLINKQYNNTVQFLTESENRYISSWLNIMRDDYGMINFDARRSHRDLLYRPHELTREAMINRIGLHQTYQPYYQTYYRLINNL